jgi:hypothetical protein
LSKKAARPGPLARLRSSPLLTWLVVAACRWCCVDVQYQLLSLAHVVVCFQVLQKCQILSANDDLEFPAPACGALLPLAPIGARIQPLPFAPPSPFGRPALERLAARGTLLCLTTEATWAWFVPATAISFPPPTPRCPPLDSAGMHSPPVSCPPLLCGVPCVIFTCTNPAAMAS